MGRKDCSPESLIRSWFFKQRAYTRECLNATNIVGPGKAFNEVHPGRKEDSSAQFLNGGTAGLRDKLKGTAGPVDNFSTFLATDLRSTLACL